MAAETGLKRFKVDEHGMDITDRLFVSVGGAGASSDAPPAQPESMEKQRRLLERQLDF